MSAVPAQVKVIIPANQDSTGRGMNQCAYNSAFVAWVHAVFSGAISQDSLGRARADALLDRLADHPGSGFGYPASRNVADNLWSVISEFVRDGLEASADNTELLEQLDWRRLLSAQAPILAQYMSSTANVPPYAEGGPDAGLVTAQQLTALADLLNADISNATSLSAPRQRVIAEQRDVDSQPISVQLLGGRGHYDLALPNDALTRAISSGMAASFGADRPDMRSSHRDAASPASQPADAASDISQPELQRDARRAERAEAAAAAAAAADQRAAQQAEQRETQHQAAETARLAREAERRAQTQREQQAAEQQARRDAEIARLAAARAEAEAKQDVEMDDVDSTVITPPQSASSSPIATPAGSVTGPDADAHSAPASVRRRRDSGSGSALSTATEAASSVRSNQSGYSVRSGLSTRSVPVTRQEIQAATARVRPVVAKLSTEVKSLVRSFTASQSSGVQTRAQTAQSTSAAAFSSADQSRLLAIQLQLMEGESGGRYVSIASARKALTQTRGTGITEQRLNVTVTAFAQSRPNLVPEADSTELGA